MGGALLGLHRDDPPFDVEVDDLLVQGQRRAVLHHLLGEVGDQVAGVDFGVAGHVEDVLFGVQCGELPAELGQAVYDFGLHAAQARVVGRVLADRPAADDGDVVYVVLG